MKPYGKPTESYEEESATLSTSSKWAINTGRLLTSLIGFLALIYVISWSPYFPPESGLPSARLDDHCRHVPPINHVEFHHRQAALAEKLQALNASAYIAEPGPSAAYYGNISRASWGLSERPLLLIVSALPIGKSPSVRISVLTPKFEATRAKKLSIPSEVQYVEWPEERNPYELVAAVIPNTTGTIFVDGGIRKFVADGIQSAFPRASILSAPEEITQLRERKSDAEIDIMRCANEATLLAIRVVHRKLYAGIRESEARTMAAAALLTAGLKGGKCLTLFGENAALPHGSGTDRIMGASDFALFDCTASLHGYYSDVTRTVALPGSDIPTEYMNVWKRVHAAQGVALNAAHVGIMAKSVDEAARTFIADGGYAPYFTHRLGHGIGLEVHEEPYLRGGSNAVLKTGHTFSDEPGIYIEGIVGVRLEDCFFINGEGFPVVLTQGVGGRSASPWAP